MGKKKLLWLNKVSYMGKLSGKMYVNEINEEAVKVGGYAVIFCEKEIDL